MTLNRQSRWFLRIVLPGKVEDYLAWRRKVIDAQAHFPGYLATRVFQAARHFQK